MVSRIPLVMGAVAIISLAVYVFWFPYKYETSSRGLYGISTLYRWIPYFGFMLMGAWVGLRTKTPGVKMRCKWYDPILFLLSLGVFYGIQLIAKKHLEVAPWQIVTLLPLAGIVFYFYKMCNAIIFEKVYHAKYGNLVIMIVSGLCLESYLIQHYLFTDKLNGLFPLNIPVMMLIILFASYVCRCLARAFSQTFGVGEYDWKKVFALV